jgi:hypothetical protein
VRINDLARSSPAELPLAEPFGGPGPDGGPISVQLIILTNLARKIPGHYFIIPDTTLLLREILHLSCSSPRPFGPILSSLEIPPGKYNLPFTISGEKFAVVSVPFDHLYLLIGNRIMMYLLLRNNKQSGPYSLDDLKTMGLKAYDLVWVDGKSAAWRYPCEIEELSSFAPAVEEQPFDRFYKRTPAAATASTASTPHSKAASVPPVSKSPEKEENIYTGEPSTVPGKRIIYVTMPAGKGPAVLRESIPSREPVRNNVANVIPARSTDPEPRPINIQFVDSPSQPTGSRPSAPAEKDPMAAYLPAPSRHETSTDEKLSQFQDDWKNTVELTPPGKRNRSRILQSVAVVVCILALLAAGIFIGLSINKDSFGFRQKIASRDALKNNGSIDRTSQQLPVAVTTSAVPSVQSQTSPTDSLRPSPLSSSAQPFTAASGNALTDLSAGKAQAPRQMPPRGKPITGNSRSQALPVTISRDSSVSASMALPVIHREAVHRTDLPAADKSDNADKDVIRNTIANLVSVGANGYTVGTFGGISDLQLTVSNRSVYPLDLVVVEVEYIQANKKTFKTENLYFRGIAPGSALMQEAPKSARGIKVQYKIILVNSKELGLSYSGI